MSDTVPLHAEQQTMLMTLRLHAQDAAADRPILGDAYAADLLARAGEPLSTTRGLDGNLPAVCARARLVDEVTRGFLREHPDAVVLHLGCGVDSRVLRVDPGPGVSWWDVDQAPVVALRRRLYNDRAGVTTVAARVEDQDWWGEVPADRPRLVVAEGLLMYLTPDVVRTTVRRSLSGPGARVLVADTVAPWIPALARRHPAMRAAQAGFASATPDLVSALAGEPARRETASVAREAAVRTTGAMSAFLRAFASVPVLSRAMVLHRCTRVDR